MTAQEIFDKVWHHMAAQKVQSLNTNGCAYRGKNGTACAVGCLLDDETAYNFDDMGDTSIEWIYRQHENIIPKNLMPHIELLIQLQLAHDAKPFGEPWSLEIFQDRAREVAVEFDLTVPEVKND